MLLTRGTFVQLRGLAWMALAESGSIVTKGSLTDDAGGGVTYTPSAGTAIPCRIDPVGARSGQFAAQIDERSTHVITVAPETTVTTNDTFRIGATDYEITAVRSRTQEAVRELEAVKA